MFKADYRLFVLVAALDPFADNTPEKVSVRETIAIVAIPTGVIATAESLITTGNEELGLGVYVLLLLFSTLFPLVRPPHTSLLQGFMLIPVFRLVNLGMPAFVELTLYWLPLVYAPMLLAIALVVRSNPMVLARAGWRTGFLTLPLAAVVGVLLAQLEYALVPSEALVPTLDPVGALVLGLVMVGAVALVEEALFRGILQTLLEDEIGTIAGIVLASAIFAILYAGGSSPPVLLFAFALGLFYGVVFNRTDSLLAVVAIHGSANLFLYGVFPLWGPLIDLSLTV